jgi:cysteinyl-tRNA synthetase
MRKRKEKKLTKEQHEMLRMQTVIDQHAHDLRYKNSEIEKLKKEVTQLIEARNKFDTKLYDVRGHVSAALNYARAVKSNMPQQDVFQAIGKMQGRLEAAQGYDGYSITGSINTCGVGVTTAARF